MTETIRWSGTVTAVSSIAHGGQQLGTTTLLRREKMLLADGGIDYVPVISGNTLRGWLRRVGEDLLREQLQYDGQLSLTAVDLRARHLTPVELVAATRHGVRGRLKQLSEGSWGSRGEDTLWSRDASGLASDYQQLARELLTRIGDHEGRHQVEQAVGATS